jgi:hypothetical protein
MTAILAGAVSEMSFDTDAAAYITAVETADAASLPTHIKNAINDFVVGAKADGFWSAIKAACFLAGPATLNGALVPLVGPAPTNVGGLFVAGDYNQLTGLSQNTSASKWLDSNYSNTADARQNNNHQAVWATQGEFGVFFLGNNFNSGGGDNALSTGSTNIPASRNMHSTAEAGFAFPSTLQNNVMFGSSRAASGSYTVRLNSTNYTISRASATPSSGSLGVFRLSQTASFGGTNLRIAFYSAGNSLSLALLDARLTTYMTAIATPTIFPRRRRSRSGGGVL